MRSRMVETGTSEHGYNAAPFNAPNPSAPPTTFVILEFPLKANRVSAAKAIAHAPMTFKDVPVKVVRIRPDFELERDALLHTWAEGFAERHELMKELHLTIDLKNRVIRRNTDMAVIAKQSTLDWAVSPMPGVE